MGIFPRVEQNHGSARRFLGRTDYLNTVDDGNNCALSHELTPKPGKRAGCIEWPTVVNESFQAVGHAKPHAPEL